MLLGKPSGWLLLSVLPFGLAGCNDFQHRTGPDPVLSAAAVQDASRNKSAIMVALAQDAGYFPGDKIDYYRVAEAGFNFVDDECRSYFNALFFLDRRRDELKSGFAAAAATTAAILTATGASQLSLGIVAAAFGLASNATDIYAGTYLYRLPPATTLAFVERLQSAFRDGAAAHRDSIDSLTTAYYVIQRYLNLCLPPTIEAEITKQISSTDAFNTPAGGGALFSVQTFSVAPPVGVKPPPSRAIKPHPSAGGHSTSADGHATSPDLAKCKHLDDLIGQETTENADPNLIKGQREQKAKLGCPSSAGGHPPSPDLTKCKHLDDLIGQETTENADPNLIKGQREQKAKLGCP